MKQIHRTDTICGRRIIVLCTEESIELDDIDISNVAAIEKRWHCLDLVFVGFFFFYKTSVDEVLKRLHRFSGFYRSTRITASI